MANQTRKFAVVLEPEEDGGFTVRVPALPEIVTCGEDEQEALAMAEDAIRLVIEDRMARGEAIPTPQMPRIREITSHSPHERAAAGAERQGRRSGA